MKRQLLFINSQNGFFLPYVLFITSLILLTLATNVSVYKNNLHITKNHLNELKIETLVQMGRAKFEEEISQLSTQEGSVSYSFPQGEVDIAYFPINDTSIQLSFSVVVDDKLYRNINVMELNQPKAQQNKIPGKRSN